MGTCATEKEDDARPEYFIQRHPVAFKMVALLFVVSLVTGTRNFIMLVKAHKKTARGGRRIIVVQYLEDWRI